MPRPGFIFSLLATAALAGPAAFAQVPAATATAIPEPAAQASRPLAPLAKDAKLDKSVTPEIATTLRRLVYGMNPKAEVKQIADSPFPGLKTVVADHSVIYASDDGRYFLYGILIDTKRGQNLTDNILGKMRVDALQSIPERDLISIKPAKPRYVVTVFTDTSCPYCTALHRNEAGYLAAGIQINYVPWPRAGMTAPNLAEMQRVWCAQDRAQAYAEVITGKPLKNPSPASCAAAKDFAQLFDLGLKLGIEGTPAIFDATGRKLGGFLPPEQLLAKLQELDLQKAPANAIAEK